MAAGFLEHIFRIIQTAEYNRGTSEHASSLIDNVVKGIIVCSYNQLKIMQRSFIFEQFCKCIKILLIVLVFCIHIFNKKVYVIPKGILDSPGNIICPFKTGMVGMEEEYFLTENVYFRLRRVCLCER